MRLKLARHGPGDGMRHIPRRLTEACRGMRHVLERPRRKTEQFLEPLGTHAYGMSGEDDAAPNRFCGMPLDVRVAVRRRRVLAVGDDMETAPQLAHGQTVRRAVRPDRILETEGEVQPVVDSHVERRARMRHVLVRRLNVDDTRRRNVDRLFVTERGENPEAATRHVGFRLHGRDDLLPQFDDALRGARHRPRGVDGELDEAERPVGGEHRLQVLESVGGEGRDGECVVLSHANLLVRGGRSCEERI